jgi:regulator of sigma E protease
MVTLLTFLFVTVPAFLFVFSIVVVFHELGHFFAARTFGITVERFSLGFGRPLVSVRDRRGTEWTLAAIPLGGYVKFFGDASAASNPDTDRLAELRAQIESTHGREAVEGCYHFKPVWQRAIVAAAGPLANFVLALAIFVGIIAIMGDGGYPPVVGAVTPDSPAAVAGIAKGDRIVEIGGRPVRYYRDIQQFAALSSGDRATVTVERGDRRIDLEVTVGRRVATDQFGGESEVGFLGVTLGVPALLAAPAPDSPAAAAGFQAGDRIVAINGGPVDFFVDVERLVEEAGPGPATFLVDRGGERLELTPVIATRTVEGEEFPYLGLYYDASDVFVVERFGPLGTVARAASWTWEAGAAPVRYIARTLTGRESGRELGGPLRIGRVAGSIAQDAYEAGADLGPLARLMNSMAQLVMLAGFLSVAVGLLNLLPIPILDGGHLLYYAYEAVAGRPLGEGAQEWGFRIGLALVLGLMIFATWNDLRYLRVFEAIGNALS